MNNNVRYERVKELLKRELGEIIRREFPLQEVGLVNVNEVNLTGDLQSASVYVGVVGSPVQKKHALAQLNQARKRIQWLVGQAVVLKYTPVLRFIEDDSIERGNRVLDILADIEKQEQQQPAASESPKPDPGPSTPT